MDMIYRAGFMAWPVLGLSLLGVLVGLAGLVTATSARSRANAVLLPGAALLCVCFVGGAGLIGYLWSLSQVEAALSGADPASRAMLEAVGRDEAQANLILAAIGGALPLLLGVAGVVIGGSRKLDGPRAG